MIVHLRGSEAVSHEPENVPGQTQRTPSRIDIRASTPGFPLCCDIRTRPSTTRLLLDIVVSVVTAHSSYAHTCRLHILQATRNRPISDSSSSCARPEDHFLLSLLPGLELGADERMKPARRVRTHGAATLAGDVTWVSVVYIRHRSRWARIACGVGQQQ